MILEIGPPAYFDSRDYHYLKASQLGETIPGIDQMGPRAKYRSNLSSRSMVKDRATCLSLRCLLKRRVQKGQNASTGRRINIDQETKEATIRGFLARTVLHSRYHCFRWMKKAGWMED